MSLGNPRRRLRWPVGTACCALAVLSAHAGAIHGTLTRGGQPLARVPVSLVCGGEEVRAFSGPQGQYVLTHPASGRCTLTVEGASAEVPVADPPVRADFEVPPGGAALIRR